MPAGGGVLASCLHFAAELRPVCLHALTAAGSAAATILSPHQGLHSVGLNDLGSDAQPQGSVGSRGFCTASHTGAKARFYKAVHVVPTKDGSNLYEVHLDTRPVRTPGRRVISLPSYPLALAIAAEWQWQTTGKPQMYSMPLMSLTATALDQPKPRDKVIETLLKYVHTDATCCRLDQGGKVAVRQAQIHDPLLDWAAEALGWKMVPSHDLFSPPQADTTVQAVKAYLEGLDPFQLAAMEQLTAVSKSVVVAAALLHGRITVQAAYHAARVEEECQIEEWGTVEAGHDLDEADITTRIAAPSIFLRLLALR